jgi:hypothetical protein
LVDHVFKSNPLFYHLKNRRHQAQLVDIQVNGPVVVPVSVQVMPPETFENSPMPEYRMETFLAKGTEEGLARLRALQEKEPG